MSINPYDKSSKSFDLFQNRVSETVGVDFRQELHDILWVDKLGSDILYRRVQMENGHPKRCECRKGHRSEEPSRDIPCENCSGMGFYYNDVMTRTYINHSQAYTIYKKFKADGTTNVEYKTSYFEWDFLKNAIDDGDNIPNRFDRIIQLKKDMTGKILSPSTAREVYEILSVDPYRLDNNGRIEYYRIRIISVIDKSFLV